MYSKLALGVPTTSGTDLSSLHRGMTRASYSRHRDPDLLAIPVCIEPPLCPQLSRRLTHPLRYLCCPPSASLSSIGPAAYLPPYAGREQRHTEQHGQRQAPEVGEVVL